MKNIMADNNFKKQKFKVKFSNDIIEIPYGQNYRISKNAFFRKSKFTFIFKRRYKLQFIFSSIVALIFILIFIWKLYFNRKQERISKELLNNYQITTLYSGMSQYDTNYTNNNISVENPFVIGIIKIDKIQLNYPILSETNDNLLKISLCRFVGPMPNEPGNLAIAGHNYIDNTFFSKLNELEIGDLIEIYGLSGKKQNYYVFKKYDVEFDDLSCVNQNVGNEKIITLLTCDNFNQTKRIVIQAK